jgi:hypothetical protein
MLLQINQQSCKFFPFDQQFRYYQNNLNQNSNPINMTDGKNVCKFFRECIDISIEALTESKNKIDMLNAIKKELKNHTFNLKITEKEIHERKKKKFVWFYGLSNEQETIQNAMKSLDLENMNDSFQKSLQAYKRDQFNDLFSFPNSEIKTQISSIEDDSMFKINYVAQLRNNLFQFLNNVPTIKNQFHSTYLWNTK